jgi:hypothetical protein
LRKWKKSLLQRNPAKMTWHNVWLGTQKVDNLNQPGPGRKVI